MKLHLLYPMFSVVLLAGAARAAEIPLPSFQEKVQLPSLSLSGPDLAGPQTFAPSLPRFAPALTPKHSHHRITPLEALSSYLDAMPMYRPDPLLDYKLQVLPPDPGVDYKLSVYGVGPAEPSSLFSERR